MNLPQYNLNTILSDYFRLICFGAGQSGKTYFITQKLIPVLLKKYQKWFVITPSYNQSVYKQVLPIGTCTFIDSTKFSEKCGLEQTLSKLQFLLDQTKTGKDTSGHSVYKWNSIVILDDVLSPKFSRSEGMINLFARFRHYQVSTIMTSNAWKVLVSPLMLNNTTHIAMFKMKGMPRNDAINQLKDFFNYNSEKEGKSKAEQIFSDYIENKQFGSLLLENVSNKLFFL